jgi:uncharacterized protein involved in outer membrane biogenesis
MSRGSPLVPWPLRLLWGIVVMFLVIILIVWAAGSVALNHYIKDEAEASLSRDAGQKVTIGHLRVGLDPTKPGIAAIDVKIGDDPKAPVAEAEKVEGAVLLQELRQHLDHTQEHFLGSITGLKLDGKPSGDYEAVFTQPKDMRVAMSNLKGEFRGAKVTGEASDALDHRWKADLNLENLDYGVLAEGVKGGKAHLKLRLAGVDEPQRAIIGSLSGRATLVGGEGRLEGRALNLWAGSLLTAFLPGSKDTHINCTVADFDMKDGVAVSRTVIIDTDKATITGKGNVDFVHQRVNMRFTPRTKGLGAVVSLATPMVVSGPFGDISSHPDPTGMAEKMGGFLLSAVTPAAALLPLLHSSEGNPCEKFLETGGK